MKKRYVTQQFNIGSMGHEKYDFVDAAVNDDNKLFIDPYLIECSNNGWCNEAGKIMFSFFDCLFSAYRHHNTKLIKLLLSHAGEQNGTRLGYGRGDNGKGNTAEGLEKIFCPLEELITKIRTINKPEDLSVFIPGFAEDGMSDLLTNILHEQLNNFTLTVLKNYGICSNRTISFYTWSIEKREWINVKRSSILVDGKELLLVPKNIVRKNYLFGAGQYFSRIILERMIEDGGYRDSDGKSISKKDIIKSKRYSGEHWQYSEVINYSTKHNDTLEEYHKKLPSFYLENGQIMSDEELDEVVYGFVNVQSA